MNHSIFRNFQNTIVCVQKKSEPVLRRIKSLDTFYTLIISDMMDWITICFSSKQR